MEKVTSFSDKLLIKAASDYVYRMSMDKIYADPLSMIKADMDKDFNYHYEIVKSQTKAFVRDEMKVNLRYLIIKDVKSEEYAFIFQGSEGEFISLFSGRDEDWSNNFSSAAHLPLDNYALALAEFKYYKEELGYNITAVSGNSLGGGYALNLAETYPNIRIIGLNPSPPEFKNKYFQSKYSTILITSSDVLSRSLILDETRLNDKSKTKLEKLKDVYGYDVFFVEKSIPYTSMLNIESSHMGALNNYRQVMDQIYRKNSLYYNTKIMAKSNSKVNFSKYLIKKSYKEFESEEYIDFYDNYIYPALVDEAQIYYQSYSQYPNLVDFLTFDTNSLDLIKHDGLTMYNESFLINDQERYFENSRNLINSYQKSKHFLVVNSLSALDLCNLKNGIGYNPYNFISSELKFSINFDWSLFKILVDTPVSLKVRLVSIVEKNWLFIYQLLSQGNKEFKMIDTYNAKEVEEYIVSLRLALTVINDLSNDVISDYKILNSNLNKVLNTRWYQIKKVDLKKLSLHKNIDINEFDSLKLSIMDHHFDNAHQSLKDSNLFIRENIDVIVNSTNELIDEIIRVVKNDVNSEENSKLAKQFESLKENINFTVFFNAFIDEYQYSLTEAFLKDSVAIQVRANIFKLRELSYNMESLLNNQERYLKRNVNGRYLKHLLQENNEIKRKVFKINGIIALIVK